ncbi:hypothetical protein WJX72_001834 [[Myrmecia] bisecta]|uniref:Uncharacterized protein n=1 Tax=[Myrmecia] bisecta TaxID=41462 RepID=A0AAW1QEA9_9CHLO
MRLKPTTALRPRTRRPTNFQAGFGLGSPKNNDDKDNTKQQLGRDGAVVLVYTVASFGVLGAFFTSPARQKTTITEAKEEVVQSFKGLGLVSTLCAVSAAALLQLFESDDFTKLATAFVVAEPVKTLAEVLKKVNSYVSLNDRQRGYNILESLFWALNLTASVLAVQAVLMIASKRAGP